MRVSVIIPSHNGAWCIDRTLRSVQRQTLDDFEAIVVDDGSSDGTAQVAAASVEGDGRFHIVSQPNAGVAAARNRALALSRGAFVAPLDHDDLWEPTFLEQTVGALERRGEAAVMAFARSVLIDAEGRAPPQGEAEMPAQVDYRQLLRCNPIGNGSCMVARGDALRAVGFDEDLVACVGQGEDWWTQLQLSWRGGVIFVDQPLVKYRISAQGASVSQNRRSARATLEVIRRARTYGPRLRTRDYLDGRSLALLWQARRAKAARQTRLAIELAARAYGLHPLWFLTPELRQPLWRWAVNRTTRRRTTNVWSDLIPAADAERPGGRPN